MMRTNWQYLILAFALAVFSWHLVSGREKVDTWIQVPVEMVNMPEGYIVRQGMVNRIEVRVRGPRPMLRTIDMRNAFYPLDLAGLQAGMNQLEFETRDINLSRAIEVVEIVPSRVELLVDRLMTKSVPVVKNLEVQLDEDFELRRFALRPPEVVVRGPQGMVEPVEEVTTQLVKVEEKRPGQLEVTVGLILPAEVEANPTRVTLALDFGEKTTDIELDREVQVMQPVGMVATLSPAKVQVHLNVPISKARDAEFAQQVRVVAGPLGELTPGEHDLGYRVELPSEAKLIRSEPESLQVTLKPVEPESDGQERGTP
jgi:YbbR domain-containing protein